MAQKFVELVKETLKEGIMFNWYKKSEDEYIHAMGTHSSGKAKVLSIDIKNKTTSLEKVRKSSLRKYPIVDEKDVPELAKDLLQANK